MKEPNDSRDTGSRAGSPSWIYRAAVTVAGLGLLVVAARGLTLPAAADLAGHQAFWIIAALTLASEYRPLVTAGRSGPDTGAASLIFSFAALLYWGFPVAAVLGAGAAVLVALSGRTSLPRAAPGIAGFVLSLAAAAAVLAAGHIQPTPLRPWRLDGDELGTVGLAVAAYFTVSFLLAGVGLALRRRAPVLATLRGTLRQAAFINLALLSAAPLVVVVMDRSALFLLLLLPPLAAVYANAAMSVQREHQALHDQLTGLPNRALLHRRTSEALAEAARTGTKSGFLLLDLDRFKEVNDTLGHPLGDALLQVVARRLSRSVRPGDVVARLGGDEFAVLLPSVRTSTAARVVAARLRAALAEPVRLEGMSLRVGASVGIALYPDDGSTVEVLLQRADVAMYLAKERRTGVERYLAAAAPLPGQVPPTGLPPAARPPLPVARR